MSIKVESILSLIIGFVFILEASASETRSNHFESVRKLVSEGNLSAALNEVAQMQEKKLSEEDKQIRKFAQGVLLFENQKWTAAETFLRQFLDTKSDIAAYALYYLGMSLRNQGKLDEALQSFEKLLKIKPPKLIKYQTHFALSEIHMQKNKWHDAFVNLYYLQRYWSYSPQYPEVLWRLVGTDIQQKKRWRACRWARKLYGSYPSHALVYDWGIDLQNAQVNGSKLGCLASPADQSRRIRRLQWAGESDRARRELEQLRERANPSNPFPVDMMFAEFLVNEGFVEEAVQTLLPYYEKQQKDFEYLMLFAKASSRSGEVQAAVGAYQKAYELKPRSSSGSRALFQAAFLSYQFQDYDGASRRFKEFISKHGKSSLAHDSQWHLAWIRYLRGDFQGAYLNFKHMFELNRKSRRFRRRYPSDRLQYWMAMSLLRMNKSEEAQALFQSLIKEDPTDYYAYAAEARLSTLPKSTKVRELAAEKPADSQVRSTLTLSSQPQVVLPSLEQAGSLSEEESNEVEAESLAESSSPTEGDVAEPSVSADEVGEVEKPEPVTEFQSPLLQARFDRAKRLMDLGFYEWARWELYEIEKQTRNKTYLRMLMSSYETIESYNRSSYISEIYFSTSRNEGGLKKEAELWQYAYPRAYEKEVQKNAGQFGIPEEFIWSIIRAESHYKPDVVSPVGAKGLMQLMPHTSQQVAKMLGDRQFSTDALTVPEVNIRLGTRYLQRLGKKFDNLIPLMAAGYNAGPHRVESWLVSFGHLEMDEFIDHIPFLETRNYVKKVVRNYAIYKKLYTKKETSLVWLKDPLSVPIPDRASTRENWESI